MPMKYARLTEPLVRDNGAVRRASWDEALAHAASGFHAAVEAKGLDVRHAQLFEGHQRGQLPRAEVHARRHRHQQHRLV
jgi:anaerobic selenocysteine-containing dehydrogenase